MKRILLFLLLSVLSCALVAQTGPSKKCPTCGLSMGKCQYKGKHPQSATLPKTPAKPTPSKPVRQIPSISPATGYENGHGWVDLGLSVKWATCNVGATSPSGYGGHYAWGETRTKLRYDWDNCFDYLDSKGDSWSVCKIGGKTIITPTSGHDTARENWGGTWRMPTDAEFDELCSKCKWVRTSRGGHNGNIVTGPNGNSIFLPAAGFRSGTDSHNMGMLGYYWSSTLGSSGSDDALCLYFDCDYHFTGGGGCYSGFSVRPVTE